MQLTGKVAVITGGASGMGKDTVLRFLAEGACVVVADYNAETGEATLAEAAAAGHQSSARFIKTDVADEADVEAMIDLAIQAFGRLDIVFNNAGVGGAIGPITETTTASWDYTMDVLAKGVFLGMKHAARVMIPQGTGGSIINTASVAGLTGDGGPMIYSAAKAAVISLSKTAAIELAEHRIRVNAICPGFIATPLAAAGRDADSLKDRFAVSQPWPEPGQGEHIAGAALFLAGDDSTFVTGESLIVDGGLTAAGPDLSKKFPKIVGRNSRYVGVTKGSTGDPPDLTERDR